MTIFSRSAAGLLLAAICFCLPLCQVAMAGDEIDVSGLIDPAGFVVRANQKTWLPLSSIPPQLSAQFPQVQKAGFLLFRPEFDPGYTMFRDHSSHTYKAFSDADLTPTVLGMGRIVNPDGRVELGIIQRSVESISYDLDLIDMTDDILIGRLHSATEAASDAELLLPKQVQFLYDNDRVLFIDLEGDGAGRGSKLYEMRVQRAIMDSGGIRQQNLKRAGFHDGHFDPYSGNMYFMPPQPTTSQMRTVFRNGAGSTAASMGSSIIASQLSDAEHAGDAGVVVGSAAYSGLSHRLHTGSWKGTNLAIQAGGIQAGAGIGTGMLADIALARMGFNHDTRFAGSLLTGTSTDILIAGMAAESFGAGALAALPAAIITAEVAVLIYEISDINASYAVVRREREISQQLNSIFHQRHQLDPIDNSGPGFWAGYFGSMGAFWRHVTFRGSYYGY